MPVDAVPIVICAIAAALVVAPAADALRKAIRSSRNRHSPALYEDKDGAASAESLHNFSATGQQIALLLFTIASCALSLTLAVLHQLHGDLTQTIQGWLLFGCHVLASFLSIHVLFERRPIKQFEAALSAAFTYIVLAFAVFFVRIYHPTTLERKLYLANLLTVLFACLAGLFFPRRPEVFYRGRPVDGQHTVSVISRLTFSWCATLLSVARATGELTMEDLPSMDSYVRATNIHNSRPELKTNESLFWMLVRFHAWPLTLQYTFTLLQAVFLLAPQYSLYNLLKALEARVSERGNPEEGAVQYWAIALAVSTLALSFVDGWMWFVSYTQLQVPGRIQLSALIFSKSMRRKDVKGSAAQKESEPEDDPADGEKGDEDKTRQGTVNLVGIDAKRVSDFMSIGNWFFGSTIKLFLSFGFLMKIIGWQSVLAGLVVQILSIPFNIHFSKQYTNAQNGLMKSRDKKLAVINEILNGIRHIKFAAFEDRVQQHIASVRNTELRMQWQAFSADVILIFCWLVGPIMLSAVSLTVYTLLYGSLSASIAFTTMGVLSSIMVTLGFLPELTTIALDAWISLRRIEKYLHAPDRDQYAKPGNVLAFKNASISWPSDDEDEPRPFIIKDINLEFPANALSVISGQTGSGKSLLLAAIIGEADLLSGDFFIPFNGNSSTAEISLNKSNWIIPSDLAFVSQQPWVENTTFRENILFSLPLDKERYEKVISACSLGQDRKLLTDGDDTEIGANGINLSGGQKWRITLARALYSRAGIVVMDDIFSAVDAHVGRHIFENALSGDICKGRTLILATHHASLVLSKAQYTVHLSNGVIEHTGLVEKLEQTGEISAILEDEESALMEVDEGLPQLLPVPTQASHHSHRGSTGLPPGGDSLTVRKRRPSAVSQLSGIEHSPVEDPLEQPVKMATAVEEPRKFVEIEKKESGRVSFSIYWRYLSATGGAPFWTLVLFSYAAYQSLMVARSWWLAMWTRSYSPEARAFNGEHLVQQNIPVYHRQELTQLGIDKTLHFYLTGYIIIALALCVGGCLRYWLVFSGSIRGSRKLFDDLTFAVLRAPLRWLDTIPVGRILNRFTSDFNTIDSELATCVAMTIYNILIVISIIIAGIVVSPWMIAFALMAASICAWFAIYYVDGARELKRLESNAKSPIFELFRAALAGVGTIRAFRRSDTYITNMFGKIDSHGETLFYMWTLNRWLTCRLGIVGAAFAFIMGSVIAQMKNFDPSLAGFALSFALQYTDAIFWLLRQYATVEMAMNSTERIIEYSEIEIEKQDGIEPPAAWPAQGRVEVDDLVITYAPDLPPVLRAISFRVEPKERCAVVGRTGAGKSSLTLAIFRFLEATSGSIAIDGLDIAKLKLFDLRSRLAIIPQDPVLFSGTVRSNLDPYEEYDDSELLEALKRVHLIESDAPPQREASGTSTPNSANVNPFSSLNTSISEGGQNLSQGQRQLLCLARAIISRPKILILDEATSAVDKATDELIQRSFREQFQNSTLIVIAHRLSTIADFDRVLVLGDGKVLEYDRPSVLVEKQDGEFRGLVERSGEKDLIMEKISQRGK